MSVAVKRAGLAGTRRRAWRHRTRPNRCMTSIAGLAHLTFRRNGSPLIAGLTPRVVLWLRAMIAKIGLSPAGLATVGAIGKLTRRKVARVPAEPVRAQPRAA